MHDIVSHGKRVSLTKLKTEKRKDALDLSQGREETRIHERESSTGERKKFKTWEVVLWSFKIKILNLVIEISKDGQFLPFVYVGLILVPFNIGTFNFGPLHIGWVLFGDTGQECPM